LIRFCNSSKNGLPLGISSLFVDGLDGGRGGGGGIDSLFCLDGRGSSSFLLDLLDLSLPLQ
jgi:hypothetical protein